MQILMKALIEKLMSFQAQQVTLLLKFILISYFSILHKNGWLNIWDESHQSHITLSYLSYILLSSFLKVLSRFLAKDKHYPLSTQLDRRRQTSDYMNEKGWPMVKRCCIDRFVFLTICRSFQNVSFICVSWLSSNDSYEIMSSVAEIYSEDVVRYGTWSLASFPTFQERIFLLKINICR